MKKAISVILSIVTFICFTITPVAATYDIKNNSVIFSKSEVTALKKSMIISTKEDKTNYIKAIFEQLNINPKIANTLTDSQLEAFVNADRIYGVSEDTLPEITSQVSTFASGDNSAQYEKMNLTVIWVSSGNTYTCLGIYSWLDKPWTKYKDIVALGTNAGSINQEESTLSMFWVTEDGIETEKNYREGEEYDDCTYLGEGTTAVFEINIPNDFEELSFAIGTEITVDHAATLTGTYHHKKVLLNASISVAIYVGVSVSPQSYYDKYPVQCGLR